MRRYKLLPLAALCVGSVGFHIAACDNGTTTPEVVSSNHQAVAPACACPYEDGQQVDGGTANVTGIGGCLDAVAPACDEGHCYVTLPGQEEKAMDCIAPK